MEVPSPSFPKTQVPSAIQIETQVLKNKVVKTQVLKMYLTLKILRFQKSISLIVI
jgi:hypothetical protein